MPSLFGLETEYAFTATSNPHSSAASQLSMLMEAAGKVLIHLPGVRDPGYYLANGGRLYVDSGGHPEFATPECSDPWEAVRYAAAGDRILQELLERWPEEFDGESAPIIYKSNVDYGGRKASWGAHDSYLHTGGGLVLPDALIPHLVTRIVYSGAGGFNPRGRGLQFVLSPRSTFMERAVSGESTQGRGIYHTKDEPLARGTYHRLHIICGETLCSQTALWLKVGATALVVALLDAGIVPSVQIDQSLAPAALRRLSADPSLRMEILLRDGRKMTAVQIQRAYLELAEQRAGEPFMPQWAGEVCRLWRDTLDRLESDPSSLRRTLDWAIKHDLYRARVESRGMNWETLPIWSSAVERILTALDETEHRNRSVSVEFVLGAQSPIPQTIREITPSLVERGLDWSGLRPFIELRREMLEIDTRFGQLDPKGIFQSLDAAGVLEHRIPGVDPTDHAMHEAPIGGRAAVRGRWIRELASQGATRIYCDWQGIWNIAENKILDLADPFGGTPEWRDLSRTENCQLEIYGDFLWPCSRSLRERMDRLRRRREARSGQVRAGT